MLNPPAAAPTANPDGRSAPEVSLDTRTWRCRADTTGRLGQFRRQKGPLDAARGWSPGLFHSRKCASKSCIWGMSVQSRSRMEIGSDGCGSRGSLENSRRNEARGSWGGTTRGRCCLPSPYSLQGSGAGDRRSRVRRAASSAGPDPGWPLRSPEPHHRHRLSGSIR